MRDRAGFKKNTFVPEMEFFCYFLGNLEINFSEFGLLRKFILFAIFLYKCHIWEKSCS